MTKYLAGVVFAAFLIGAPLELSGQDVPEEPAVEEEAAPAEEPAAEAVAAVEEAVAEAEAEQPEEVAAEEPGTAIPAVLFGILKWVLGATGLTFLAQFLRRWNIPQKIPGVLRPLIGPLLGTVAVALSNLLGFPVDLSIIEGALLGATSGLIFDAGNELGLFAGTSNG